MEEIKKDLVDSGKNIFKGDTAFLVNPPKEEKDDGGKGKGIKGIGDKLREKVTGSKKRTR